MQRLPASTDAPSFAALLALQAGRNVFDIGANIGQAAAVFAPNFKHVYSFEPCREALAILMVEAPMNVVVIPKAVSDHGGQVTLTETEHAIETGQLTTGTGLGWGKVIGERIVDCTTVDQACEHFHVEPDLVKVDTEGHEVKVLRGAKGLIGRRHATWLIEVHDRANEEPIRLMLDGYDVARIDHDYLRGSEQGLDHFYLRAVPA